MVFEFFQILIIRAYMKSSNHWTFRNIFVVQVWKYFCTFLCHFLDLFPLKKIDRLQPYNISKATDKSLRYLNQHFATEQMTKSGYSKTDHYSRLKSV